MAFFENLFGSKQNEGNKREQKDTIHLTFDLLRLEPPDHGVKKNGNTDRLTDLLAILFIFGIATWFRFYVRALYIAEDVYGINVFNIRIIEGDPLGFGAWLGAEPGDTVATEGYHDFYAYYLDYVTAYADGWNPYAGNRDPYDVLHAYVYGPYYMMSIGFGAKYLGMTPTDSIVYSNIILDALTYVMVYILAKRVTGNVWAMIFAVVGSFSPVALFYLAFRGLNAPIMNLSFLVSLYLYLERKDAAAMIVLAFATLTKQFPLFFAMPMGFWMMRRHGILKGISYILLFVIMFFVLSIPHILIFPVTYLTKLVLPGGSKDAITCPQGGEATNLVHGTIPPEICETYGEGNPIMTDDLPQITLIMDFLVNNHILFFSSLIVLGWLSFTSYHVLEKNPKLYYIFTAGYYYIVHATIGRGVYKYYLTFLIPLLLLAFLPGNSDTSLNIKLGATLNKGWRDWINPRYRIRDPTISYWVNGFVLLLSTAGIIWLLHSAVSMFTTQRAHYNIWMLITIPLALYFIIKPNGVKENQVHQEKDRRKSVISYSVLVVLVLIMFYFLEFIMDLYFAGFSDSKTRTLILMGAIFLLFVSVSLTNYFVTDRKRMIHCLSFELKQLVTDIGWFLLAVYIINYYHIQILTIFRLDTTTFLLYFSFLLLAMLGNEVWKTVITYPKRALNHYFMLRYEIDPINVSP